MHTSFMWKSLAIATLALPAIWPATSMADTSLKALIAEGAPIESTIQGCYGQLSYFDLSDEQRQRLDAASGAISNLVYRYAPSHSVEAYDDVYLQFLRPIVGLNEKRPAVFNCNEELVSRTEQQVQSMTDRFGSVKGPRDR
ncbi:hypothetical protein EKL30_04565 [Candidimonas sp. SYP-B2681]|uniref:hypothetical protein n=1 Tax=Candidimonas sp. SYP-B2681 TaxID=2497686 RepID=UPI000F864A60|nr:hypothetical protein [Candidimonas sp. SYP-B2681]RTZ48225.1 hypothetical protein EKL30_04565 [Candidimonas sp. SYP-B2681]